MRIAFDVKGTIEGPKKRQIIYILTELRKRGHEVVVWSNAYMFAKDAVNDNHLECEATDKLTLWDAKERDKSLYDLAIDDDSSQTWLAAKRFIWVHDVPTDSVGLAELIELIHSEKWKDTWCQTNDQASRYV